MGVQLINRNICNNSMQRCDLFSREHCIFRGKIAIVGGGPSLNGQLDDLREFDGLIMSLNGAHDYLLEQGVESDFYFQIDPKPENRFARNKKPNCIYMLASQCHPKSFADIKPDTMVHLYHERFPQRVARKKNFMFINSFGTVGITAMALAYTMGFDELHLYGIDGSIGDEHHAYEQKQNDNDTVFMHKGYKTTDALCNQMWNFQKILPLLKDCHIVINGNGLIKEVYHEFEERSGKYIERN